MGCLQSLVCFTDWTVTWFLWKQSLNMLERKSVIACALANKQKFNFKTLNSKNAVVLSFYLQ